MLDYQKILHFWFGDDLDDLAVIKRQSGLWFGKSEQVDRQIEQQFAVMLGQPAPTEALPPRQTLAQIILFDQFPRNIYRGQPEAFASDHLALQLALQGLAIGADRDLRPVERVFYYLPLEHSEQLAHQNRSVELFQALVAEVVDEWRDAFAGFLDYAIRHQVIIERFGRFPHRNAILGRSSSEEESEFLKQPGSTF